MTGEWIDILSDNAAGFDPLCAEADLKGTIDGDDTILLSVFRTMTGSWFSSDGPVSLNFIATHIRAAIDVKGTK